MTKIMILLAKRPDLSTTEFQQHWFETHQPLLLQLPGLRRLVLNQVQHSFDGSPIPYDGIGEAWYDNAAALQGSMTSPAGQQVAADTVNFLDVSKLQILVVEETVPLPLMFEQREAVLV